MSATQSHVGQLEVAGGTGGRRSKGKAQTFLTVVGGSRQVETAAPWAGGGTQMLRQRLEGCIRSFACGWIRS